MPTGSAVLTHRASMPRHELWAKVENVIRSTRKGVRKSPCQKRSSTRTYTIPTVTGDRFELTIQIYPYSCKIEFNCNGLKWSDDTINRHEILDTLNTLLTK